MPAEEAERYLDQEWKRIQYCNQQIATQALSLKIKLLVFVALSLLLLFSQASNLAGKAIIQDPLANIIVDIISPFCALATVIYWIKYQELN